MGKSLIGTIINGTSTLVGDSIDNARTIYNDAKLAYSQQMSYQAQMTGNSTWRNPNTAPYLYRNSDGDVGPLAEFNDTHKGERFRFWDVDKKMNAYRQEYNNFENEAIKKGYTVYTKDGNELFQFNKKNRNRSQEAAIGFDKDLLEIRDKNGNVIECPHAPEESYDPAYRMYDQKRTMARIANDIVNKNTPNIDGSKLMHKYYKDGLEMMENGIDPKIEALNKYGLNFDSKFDRSKTAYQTILEQEQPFTKRTSDMRIDKDVIDANFRDLSSKSDRDIVDMLDNINKYSINPDDKENENNIPRLENKYQNSKLPQSKQEFIAEAFYWIASAIQNPQEALSKFMDKYGDNIRSIIDKKNEDSQAMNEVLNNKNASSFVRGVNQEVSDMKDGSRKDYESINAYYEAQNEHIRNYNDLFDKNKGMTFKDENNKSVEIGINSSDSAKRMATINCVDAGKLKMFDKDGNEIEKISDSFTQNKDVFARIAPDAERMNYNITKHNLAEFANYSDEQRAKFSSNGKDFNAMYEETKSILPFRKEVNEAYEKGTDPIEVSMKQLQIGKYAQVNKEKENAIPVIKHAELGKTSEDSCKANINKINAALALADNISNSKNTLNYDQERNI